MGVGVPRLPYSYTYSYTRILSRIPDWRVEVCVRVRGGTRPKRPSWVIVRSQRFGNCRAPIAQCEWCVASREELWLGTPQIPLNLFVFRVSPPGLYRGLGQSPGGNYALLPTHHSLKIGQAAGGTGLLDGACLRQHRRLTDYLEGQLLRVS